MSKQKIAKLKKRASKESQADQDLVFLTIASVLIAALGVKINNEYVIIGSMIISPLFNPILSVLVPLFGKDKKGFIKNFNSLLFILALSFLVGMSFWLIILLINKYTPAIPSEQFSLSIENFLIATILGGVGMLLWIWPKINNIGAGVAIAISLVPPIAYCTQYFVFGYYDLSWNYFLAFCVNLFGTLLGGAIILRLYKKGEYETRI